jgi:hypothetical protein
LNIDAEVEVYIMRSSIVEYNQFKGSLRKLVTKKTKINKNDKTTLILIFLYRTAVFLLTFERNSALWHSKGCAGKLSVCL